ncbi:hypothetical protein HDE_12345 [Halotydeus destructor]|nr:hypothetical protein HDE_12345 [Halotydeus destructor]
MRFLRTSTVIKRRFSSLRTKQLVSTAHPVSNLRLIKEVPADDETLAERNYRIKRTELQDWNQSYWKEHNRAFFSEKEEYIKSQLLKLKENASEDARHTVTYDELAHFYKRFLDDNNEKHVNYSREWYKRHILLLGPALRAYVSSTLKRYFG